MTSYDRALKILYNKKNYTKEEIREAIGVYHSVNKISRCPVCGKVKLNNRDTTPCISCLRMFSTQLNEYYDRDPATDPEWAKELARRKAKLAEREEEQAEQKEEKYGSTIGAGSTYSNKGCGCVVVFGAFLILSGVCVVKSIMIG